MPLTHLCLHVSLQRLMIWPIVRNCTISCSSLPSHRIYLFPKFNSMGQKRLKLRKWLLIVTHNFYSKQHKRPKLILWNYVQSNFYFATIAGSYFQDKVCPEIILSIFRTFNDKVHTYLNVGDFFQVKKKKYYKSIHWKK